MSKKKKPEPNANPEPNPAPIGRPKKARCPRCGKEFEFLSVAQHKVFPFCSARCRDVDLGNWLSGKYVIPGSEITVDPDEIDESMEPHDDAT